MEIKNENSHHCCSWCGDLGVAWISHKYCAVSSTWCFQVFFAPRPLICPFRDRPTPSFKRGRCGACTLLCRKETSWQGSLGLVSSLWVWPGNSTVSRGGFLFSDHVTCIWAGFDYLKKISPFRRVIEACTLMNLNLGFFVSRAMIFVRQIPHSR